MQHPKKARSVRDRISVDADTPGESRDGANELEARRMQVANLQRLLETALSIRLETDDQLEHLSTHVAFLKSRLEHCDPDIAVHLEGMLNCINNLCVAVRKLSAIPTPRSAMCAADGRRFRNRLPTTKPEETDRAA